MRVARGGAAERASQVALDSTGLFLSHTSWYFAWRARRDRGRRGWLKWAFAMWVGPQLLLSQRVKKAGARVGRHGTGSAAGLQCAARRPLLPVARGPARG